jgi:hypothetical protein
MEGLEAVEEDALHGAVVDHPGAGGAAGLADRGPVAAVEDRSRRHRRAHHQERPGALADGGGETVAVELPDAVADLAAGEARHASSEPYAVDEADVDRVEQHHLVVRLEHRQQHVEDAVEPAGRDDRRALPVVAHPRRPRHQVGGRAAQLVGAQKRQIAVGVVAVRRLAGRLDDPRRRAQVGVEVLEAEEVRIVGVVGERPHAVDADSGHA